jgi:hypothetical protein
VTSEYKAKGRDGKRFRRCADKRDVAIAAKELDVYIDVMLSRHGIQDEVKLPACFFISSTLRETTTSSAPRRSASSFLLDEVANTTTCAPSA